MSDMQRPAQPEADDWADALPVIVEAATQRGWTPQHLLRVIEEATG